MNDEAATAKTGIDRAIEAAGGASAFAKALDESIQAISNWRARGQPPANKCAVIEQLTGVSRRDLRSDWRDYWPELIGQPGAPEVPEPAKV